MLLKTDPEFIQSYLTDASNFKTNECKGVYIPETIEEISDILKEANRTKTPITISGAGTGLVGGRVPREGYILSLEKFKKILSLDKKNKLCQVQANVTLAELQEFLKGHFLFYPPDPTEKNCSIGGTVATNASGARTLKYGSTRNWIYAIKVVLPDGEIFSLTRNQIIANNSNFNFKTESGKIYSFNLPQIKIPEVKNAAGYFIKPNMDLLDLFIGSEGTLGVITECTVKLLESPKELISMVIFFSTFEDAYSFMELARTAKTKNKHSLIEPRALEFFDDKALEFLSHKFTKVRNKNFAIWYEQEIYEENSEKILEELFDLILKCKGNPDEIWFAFNEKEIYEINEFRHSISALVNEYISRNNFRKLGTDTAVLSEHFRNFYNYCINQCKEYSINYVAYGHIGNNHLHLNMLPKNENEIQIASNLYKKFCIKAVELGGTISAEHGIGKIKREYFELMYPEEKLYGMFQIKKIFDPFLILNKYNIFPDRFFD